MSCFTMCCGRCRGDSSTMSSKKFIDECLAAHNNYRAKHGVSKLKHSKTLTTEAQKWADHLVSSGKFEHSSATVKGERLGENIAMKWSSGGDDYTGEQVADQWYSEISKHDFKSEPKSLGSGHFTQMVWKASEKVGFGKAKGKDNKIIVVANYLPAGNFVGRFVENVPPPTDKGAAKSKPTKDKSSKGKGRRGSSSSSSSSSSSDSSPETERKGSAKGSTNKSVTTTTTEENGVKITKTVTTETTIGPNGQKRTTTREQISREGPAGSMADMEGKFADMKCKHSDSSAKAVKPQKMSEFIDEAVKSHNVRRAKHGVPSLKHNKDLSKTAQAWADHLVKDGKFEHSTNTHKGEKLGENIASKWSSAGADYTGEAVVEQWYSEISKHDFKSEPKTLGSGHFTQVVWKGSREVGLGKALTSDGRVIVVANYLPAGNYVGHFVENVPQPKK